MDHITKTEFTEVIKATNTHVNTLQGNHVDVIATYLESLSSRDLSIILLVYLGYPFTARRYAKGYEYDEDVLTSQSDLFNAVLRFKVFESDAISEYLWQNVIFPKLCTLSA
jgi:hypothetical protein